MALGSVPYGPRNAPFAERDHTSIGRVLGGHLIRAVEAKIGGHATKAFDLAPKEGLRRETHDGSGLFVLSEGMHDPGPKREALSRAGGRRHDDVGEFSRLK